MDHIHVSGPIYDALQEEWAKYILTLVYFLIGAAAVIASSIGGGALIFYLSPAQADL